MVTLKEYEAYLRVKRIIDSCAEAEIISKLSNERNYTPMQTLDYAHRNRYTRIVRRKGGVKEFGITWL